MTRTDFMLHMVEFTFTKGAEVRESHFFNFRFESTFHKRSDKFSHFTPKPWEQLQNYGSNPKPWRAATPPSFSRFDVYWIQTDKQTDKQSLYKIFAIFRNAFLYFGLSEIKDTFWVFF